MKDKSKAYLLDADAWKGGELCKKAQQFYLTSR